MHKSVPGTEKGENGGLEVFQPTVMVRATTRTGSDKCHAE